jgi:chromosome segregation ATPase
MMTQMHDSAGLSVTRMAATLTAVVHDLSTRVTEMGERMSQTVTSNAGRATEVTQAMIGKVDQWSTHSTQQLAQLIEKHQAHLERVQDVQRTMETTLVHFKTALSEYATVTTGLKSVSAQTTAMVTAATGTVKNLKETGDAIERVARLATTQAERLGDSNRQQEEVQQRLAVNLQRYQQVFQEVERSASQLLEQIEQHLRSHNLRQSRRLVKGGTAQSGEMLGTTQSGWCMSRLQAAPLTTGPFDPSGDLLPLAYECTHGSSPHPGRQWRHSTPEPRNGARYSSCAGP